MTKEERFSLLAECGCIICGSPTAIHHLRVDRKNRPLGASVKNTWDMTIPLCPIHHQHGDGSAYYKGEYGFHKSPKSFVRKYGSELELLEKTEKKIKELKDNRIF